MNIVSFKNIYKSYGDNLVIEDLSFDVSAGKVFGLLGPNGAGKTTLMRLMTNITLPVSGNILFKDSPFSKKDVRRIGYMPEERGLYTNMKIFEHLLYIAKLYGIETNAAKDNIEYWLTKLGMTSFANRYIGALSKGMSQKIQFIATVIHSPDLLVLDEPFSGLDPISSQAIEMEILELKSKGTSIILSTHRMDQVETFCDEVLLINKGKKIVQGSIADLKNTYKENVICINTLAQVPIELFQGFELLFHVGNEYYFRYLDEVDRTEILKRFISNDITVSSFSDSLPRINEIFIKLINADHNSNQLQPI